MLVSISVLLVVDLAYLADRAAAVLSLTVQLHVAIVQHNLEPRGAIGDVIRTLCCRACLVLVEQPLLRLSAVQSILPNIASVRCETPRNVENLS